MSNIKKNLGHVTAYAYYKAGGGTMTEEEFTEYMADFGDAAERAVDAASEAATSEANAASSATAAANSAAAALISEENANGAMMSAYSDANRADTAADTATSAKNDAVSAKTAAQSAKTAAETAASTATTKATAAANSATAAAGSATAAANSATNAAASAQSVASSAAQITTNAEDIASLKEDLTEYNAYEILHKVGTFANGTSKSVTYTWNSDKTECAVSGTSTGASTNNIYNAFALPSGIEAGKTYPVLFTTTNNKIVLEIIAYLNGATSGGSSTFIYSNESMQEYTVPVECTGMTIRLRVSDGNVGTGTVKNIYIFNALSNEQLSNDIKNNTEAVNVLMSDAYKNISLADLEWKSGYIYSENDVINQLVHKRKGDFDTNNNRYVTNRLHYLKKGSTISAITSGYWFSVYRYDNNLNYVSRALSQTQYTVPSDGWFAIVLGTTPDTDFVANDIPVSSVLENYVSDLKTPVSKYYTEKVNLSDFAKGDGISDDTITINRVFSMLGAKDILIGNKTFIVSDRVTLPTGIYVHGCGESSVFKLADTFDIVALEWRIDYDANNKYIYPIMYSGQDTTGIVLENFTVEGSETYIDQQQIGICICGGNHSLTNMVVKNINYSPENFSSRLASVSGIGVFCFHADNVNIKGGSFYNTGYEDIGTEYATNVTIDGTYCGESNRTCIQPHRTSKDIHITNNQLENIITLGQATITVHGQGGHEISGVVITGNSIKGGKITFVGTFEHEIVINGNTFECIDPASIITTRTDVQNTRNYNFVIANNIIKGDSAAITLACDYAIIANNIIKSNATGAVIALTGGGCSANNNTFTGTNSTIDITTVDPIN